MSPRKILYVAIATIMLFYALNYAFMRRGMENIAFNFNSWRDLHSVQVLDTMLLPEIKKRGICAGSTLVFAMSSYPPAHQLATLATMKLFGNGITVINLINNSFYLLMLLVFIFLIGKHIDGEMTGLLAAVIVALYPLTYFGYGQYFFDFPLMGLTAMAIYIFLRSEDFSRRGWTIAFAASCGWGMMVKESFAPFVAGPIMFAAYRQITAKNYRSAAHFVLFLCVLAALISPYYFHPNRMPRVAIKLFEEPSGNALFAYDNIRLFTTGLWREQLSFPFFLLLIMSLYTAARRLGRTHLILLVLWILVPNIVLFLMPHWKNSRYLMPVLPAFALISAVWLSSLAQKWYGKAAVCLVIAAGIGQYYFLIYGPRLHATLFDFIGNWEVTYRYSDVKDRSDISGDIRENIENKLRSYATSGRSQTKYNVLLASSDTFELIDCFFSFNGMPLSEKTVGSYCRDDFGRLLGRESRPKSDLFSVGDLDTPLLRKTLRNNRRIDAAVRGELKKLGVDTDTGLDHLTEGQCIVAFNNILQDPDRYNIENVPYVTRDAMRQMYPRETRIDIDFILQAGFKYRPSSLVDLRSDGSFEAVKEDLMNRNREAEPITILPGAEINWKIFMGRFKTREKIAEAGSMIVYLYTPDLPLDK